jgi:dihydroorotate dehydrogenase
MLYKVLVRILFLFDPEAVHYFTLSTFRFCNKIPGLGWLLKKTIGVGDIYAPVAALGLTFKNPVGLAAGFDKDGRFMKEFAALGFGFVEVGTVTPLAQPGNEKPRLFRLRQDTAIINRMGFNNLGVDQLVERLKQKPPGFIVGANIGKNKLTPNEDALKDYEICFAKLYPHADYFVVNVSSPNTPGLRALQEKEPLRKILERLLVLRNDYIDLGRMQKPVLLKIAPDLTNEQLDDVIDLVLSTKLDGVVATNTTISREGLTTKEEIVTAIGAGGLSGAPVKSRSTEVVRYIYEKSGGRIFIIGVGGITQAEDAKEKFAAGAKLVQLYTGFIYKGPALITEIIKSYATLASK